MNPLARGYSFIMYQAEAGATYTIPFPALKPEDIRVFAGDVGDVVEQTFTWVNEGTELKLDTEVPVGILVTIRRFTPREVNLVDYQDGSNLPADDLNISNRQLLYIIQEQLDFGAYGGSGLPGGGVQWPGQGGEAPPLAIQQIIDQLMRSDVFQLLVSKIEPLDSVAETILEELLRSESEYDWDRVNKYWQEVAEKWRHDTENQVADVTTRVTEVETDVSSHAQRITEVYSKYDDAEAQIRTVEDALATQTAATASNFVGVNARIDDNEAAVVTLQTAHTDLEGSMASQFNGVSARFDDNESAISTVTEATSNLESTTATKFTAMTARFDANESRILSNQTAIADQTSATALKFTQMDARVSGNETAITDAQTAIADETSARGVAMQELRSDYQAADDAVTSAMNQTLQSTYATKNYAQSIAGTTVQSWAAGHFNILQERFEALVDGTADPGETPKWSANWTVRINSGKIGGTTPVIAGIGLGIDSQTGSSFIVMADRFGICSPTYTTTEGVEQVKWPFVVGTVGGVSTVGIEGQLLVDGSVTADKVTATELSAISANLGTVNGGTFKTHTLDAQGNVTLPNEFRVEITNKATDQFPLWIGEGVKNKNNAVFWVDRSGNAGFDGTISALNLIDKVQRTETVSWDGDVLGNPGGVICEFTLDAPLVPGQAHVPIAMLELYMENDYSDHNATAWVIIERQD